MSECIQLCEVVTALSACFLSRTMSPRIGRYRARNCDLLFLQKMTIALKKGLELLVISALHQPHLVRFQLTHAEGWRSTLVDCISLQDIRMLCISSPAEHVILVVVENQIVNVLCCSQSPAVWDQPIVDGLLDFSHQLSTGDIILTISCNFLLRGLDFSDPSIAFSLSWTSLNVGWGSVARLDQYQISMLS